MKSSLLNRVFAWADLPAALHDEVLSTYAQTYANDLALNHSLGDNAARLLTSKLGIDATVALIKSANAAVLDTWLDSSDAREKSVGTILDWWALSTTDQRRFLRRNLSSEQAMSCLRHQDLTPETRLALAKIAAPKSLNDWLGWAPLPADEAFECLELLSYHAEVFATVVPLLVAHPELRARALRSNCAVLRRSACWTVLSGEDQLLAVELAHDEVVSRYDGNHAIGLLVQPYLVPGLREQLWEFVISHGLKHDAIELGARPLGSRLHVDKPLHELSGSVIDELLDAYTVAPADSHARVASSAILVELSHNPNLTPDQFDRVVLGLVHASEDDYNARLPLILPRLRELAARIDPDAPHLSWALRNFPRSRTLVEQLDTLPSTLAPPPEISTAKKPPEFDLEYATPTVDSVLERFPALVGKSALQRHHHLLIDELGDATTKQGRSTWINLFSLLATDQEVPFGEILHTARLLAAADE
jgi:hypothetical protein